jgi:tetratricopeptide (TPR) repeat protein
MPTLRLTQSTVSPDRFRVEAALEGDGLSRQTATTEFDFTVTPQDREDLRWYLEDYLLHDADPAPKIAARIERRIAEMGAGLFKALFQANEDARDLWATLRESLNDTRIEIITEVQEATALPWELLRDPKTDTPLALRADAFVRAAHQVALRPHLPQSTTGPIRILLAICRPSGGSDVPFRSVASRLIKGLSESAREAFQLDVLRPATFARLSKVLRSAKAAGTAYHVVHFDGHGTYADVNEPGGLAALKRALSSLVLSVARAGAHGYLLFENPGVEENLQLVDGPALGKLLAETDVPVLVLNACRSAHAESPAIPATALGQFSGPNPDVHGKVRAFGSLAQEVVDSGVAGVVAMRYNVYVVTAAQFVADLYESLASGQAVGEAVTLGRKQLEAQPLREIAYQPRPLQDWMVPIVYEAAPVALFPKPAQKAELKITISADAAAPSSSALAPELEKRPDVGFFGRDETLLALDRAFDTQAIVLLHAYAGSGKTSTAAEFARWYHLTGGIDGPVLFTSFEQYKPLAQVLNETIGRVFDATLEQSGVHWLTLTDEQRRDVALQIILQIPVLWIWDNVEPIAGFPTGTQSAWSDAEQQALADFLRAAKQTKAKFLLTSRRDERDWLNDLPRLIQVPPMPMQERVQLARALAEKHGRRLADVEDWMPLLRFTGGNPLTLTVLVGQALRDGLKTKAQIEAFVARLRAGEEAFEDEAGEGRDKSLGASLSYGFEHAFSETERRQLALLHFFQGFVDVDVLRAMGNPDAPWCLPEVRGLTREAGISMLDRASEVGLLTGHGGGYYTIHPALPWFFKSLFEQYYSELPASAEEPGLKATRAFVKAMGELGNLYHNQYEAGNRDVIAALAAEEANLLHARQLARTHGWWSCVVGAMQGLRHLYDQTGRRAEWARLVHEIVPDLVSPATDGPLPGGEEQWGLVTGYRVRLVIQARQWAEAERLQRVCVNWDRQRAAPALAMPPGELGGLQRNRVRTLAVSVSELANILREQGKAECIAAYEEDYDLSLRIEDGPGAAVTAFNIGHAYLQIPSLRDLAQAEHWYRRSLELRDERDRQGQAKCLSQLGHVAYERFKEARAANQPEAELLHQLNAALQFYGRALDFDPPDALNDLATDHNQLGNIYFDAGDLDRALSRWRDSIRYEEMQGNLYGAAQTRYNVAIALARARRLADAGEYAFAALRNYETFGDRAAAEIQTTQELIAEIEQDLQAQGG